jgi:hypothetical protein
LPLTNESGFEDPNPNFEPDPAIFITDLQDANKKLIKKQKFFHLLLSEGTFTLFFKDKKPQGSQKTVGLSYYFCLMIEGSRSGPIPLTTRSGSRSGRPKTCGSGGSGSGFGSGSGTLLPKKVAIQGLQNFLWLKRDGLRHVQNISM